MTVDRTALGHFNAGIARARAAYAHSLLPVNADGRNPKILCRKCRTKRTRHECGLCVDCRGAK